MRRRLGAAGALAAAAAAALVLAGCSSGTPSASSSTTSTSRPTTTTSAPVATTSTTSSAPPATTTSAPAPGTTTTTAHPAAATCQVSQLRVAPQRGSGAAGTIELSVDLTNVSSSPCTLFGYPGMQLRAAGGAPIPTNVVRGGGMPFPVAAANQAPATVGVAPGGVAAFGLSYSDVPVGSETSCPTSATAQITPPGDFSSAVVPLSIAPCGGGTVHVSPVYLVH